MANEKGTPEEKGPGQPQGQTVGPVSDSRIFLEKAESQRLEGKYEEAIATLREGLDRMPDLLPGRLLLGRCYWERGMAAEAKKELERVARGIEECALVYQLLSRVYLEEKEVEKATEALRKNLIFQTGEDRGPKKLTPLEMGLLHRGSSPPFVTPPAPPEPTVQQESKAAEEEKGGKAPIQTDTLAEIYIKQGHLDRALITYQEILSRDPENRAVREKYEALKKRMGKERETADQKKVQAHLERWLRVLADRRTSPDS